VQKLQTLIKTFQRYDHKCTAIFFMAHSVEIYTLQHPRLSLSDSLDKPSLQHCSNIGQPFWRHQRFLTHTHTLCSNKNEATKLAAVTSQILINFQHLETAGKRANFPTKLT